MPDSTSINNTIVFVADDSDFVSISYGGRWTHNTHGEDFILPYKDTGSQGAPGATASMQFSGYSVAAFAALPISVENLLVNDPEALRLSPPNVTVTLDDNTPTRVSVPLGWNTPFFTHGALAEDRSHRLLITVDDGNVGAAFQFALDSVVYATHIASPSSVLPPPPGEQQRLSPTATGRAGAFYTAVTVQAAVPPPAPLPVAAIVGGVVGGVTLLVVAALATYLIVRSRRLRRMTESYFSQSAMVVNGNEEKYLPLADDYKSLSHEYATTTGGTPAPSSLAPSTRSSSAPSTAHTSSPPAAPSAYSASSRPSSLSSASTLSPPTLESAAARARRRKAEEAGLLSVPGAPRYHADSGVRFSSEGAASSGAGDDGDQRGSGVGEASAHEDDADEHALLLADVPPSYSAQ